ETASSAIPPKDMVPKQRGDTMTPVFPNNVYSIDKVIDLDANLINSRENGVRSNLVELDVK
ncbi:MAG: hypothetical protein KDC80_00450, partial [Saprospiraceae bacterium]|nr:hypothetical protein [Saprospiraceae bacterium]